MNYVRSYKNIVDFCGSKSTQIMMGLAKKMLTKEVCRAARVGIGWSRCELAKEAGLSERTVIDFERGARDPHDNNKRALQAALERGGVRFPGDNCLCLPPV